MDQDHAPQALLPLVQAVLFALHEPRLASFRVEWPANAASVPNTARVPASAATPAVQQWLPQMADNPPGFARNLIAGLCRAAPSLAWRQTYSLAELGDEFLRNYAYTELMGLDAPFYSQRLACGFLLLGPDTLYPRHRHEAEEIYVTLSGDAHWLQGDDKWRQHPPGTVIHHASEEPHAMKTGKQPLLALYLWRSANLNQKARLDGGATLLAACLMGALSAGCAQFSDHPRTPLQAGQPAVNAAVKGAPEALKVPDDQVLAVTARGIGVQIYQCQVSPADAAVFAWALKAPEAQLRYEGGKELGRHYAGPTWEAIDGSKVIGEVVAHDAGLDANAIPLLLLRARQTSGNGIFSNVQFIQRLHTVGGTAPAAGCDPSYAGTESRVSYTADYYFYTAGP